MFKKAVRERTKLRLALAGLAGSGKTYTALALASGLAAEMRAAGQGAGRIALIDTEYESATLYAGKFDFDTAQLTTFSPLKYVELIKFAEVDYDIIVIDSLSHAWAGEDGALDQKDKVAARSSSGNSWTAWRDVTPKHNALVNAMLGCKAHVIATMRTKMEYVQERNAKGVTEIKKVGLAAIQREGMEYEFTLVGDVDLSHTLKVAKHRLDGVLDIGDMFEKPGAALAKKIYAWLMDGAAPAAKPLAPIVQLRPTPAPPPAEVARPDLDGFGARVAASLAAAAEPQVVATEPSKELAAEIATDVTVAAAVSDAFVAYMSALTKAETLEDLASIATTSPGKPEKGTANYDLFAKHYRALKTEIERQNAARTSAVGAVAS